MNNARILVLTCVLANPLPALAEPPTLGERIGTLSRKVSNFFWNIYGDSKAALDQKAGLKLEEAKQTQRSLLEFREQLVYDLERRYYTLEYDIRKSYMETE